MTTASRIRLGAALAALGLVAILVVRTSQAAFTAQTTNEDNAFQAATMTLTDEASQALFRVDVNSGDLLPGQTIENCVPLTYDAGDAYPSQPVRLYSPAAAAGALARALDVRVDVGHGGSLDDCSGFTATGPARFVGALVAGGAGWDGVQDYASGVDLWTPAEGDAARTVRLRVSFDESADDSLQGASANQLDFTFEARS